MARPEVKGLNYFPFDVGFFRDKKIRLLRGENGAEGVEIYLRLVAKCYEENGYFLNWDALDDYALLADESGYPEDKVRLIVSSCLRRSLFDDKLFKVGNVLTSRSIQRRYFSAIKETKMKAAAQGRNTFIEKSLCLLTEDDLSEFNKTQSWLKVTLKNDISEINSSKSEINDCNSPINPAKKRKEKKSKEKETKQNNTSELCRVFLIYENVITVPSEQDKAKLTALCKGYSEDMVIQAIEASKGVGKTVNYIKGILRNWQVTDTMPDPRPKTEKSYDLSEVEKYGFEY